MRYLSFETGLLVKLVYDLLNSTEAKKGVKLVINDWVGFDQKLYKPLRLVKLMKIVT